MGQPSCCHPVEIVHLQHGELGIWELGNLVLARREVFSKIFPATLTETSCVYTLRCCFSVIMLTSLIRIGVQHTVKQQLQV